MLRYALLFLASTAVTGLPTKPMATVAPETWFPASVLSKAEQTRATSTTFDIAIDNEGRVVGCEIIVRSGVDAIDKRVCLAVVAKAKFKPAKDVQGNAVPSVIRERLIWRPTSTGESSWFEAPDYVMEEPSLRRKAKKFASVALSYRASGEIEACHVIVSTSDVRLDEKACDLVRRNHAAYPVTQIVAEWTPALRFLNVGFVYGTSELVTLR
jgi:outer membrane biosynthesis protein TonB